MADVFSEIDPTEPQDSAEGHGHPLFPRGEHETGPDKRRIDLIQVDRMREDGTLEHCPRHFKASEIRSWQDIVDRFGGGSYRLRALCGKTYQFQGSTERREFFGPAARPLAEDARSGQKSPAQQPTPAAAMPAQQPPASTPAGWPPPPPAGWPWMMPNNQNGGIAPEVLALLMKSMERPATSPQDQIMAIVLKGMLDQQTALVKMMFDRPATPSPLDALQQIKPLLDNTNGVEQLLKGVELAKSLHSSSPAAADQGEDVLTMITSMLQKLAPPASPPPPPAPPPPPPALPAAPMVTDRTMLQTIVQDPALRRQFLEMMREEAERARSSTTPASVAPPSTPSNSTSSSAASSPRPRDVAPTTSTTAPGKLAGSGTTPAQPRDEGAETGQAAEGFDLGALFEAPDVRRAGMDGRRDVMREAIEAAQREQRSPPQPSATAPPAAA